MSLPTDDTLMDLIAGGDAAACRTLLDRHLGPVLAYCQRILGSRADAEDVAQEVFVRAWAKSPEWQPGTARLTTWLHTVALNLCRDRLRRVRPDPLEDVPEPVDPSLTAEDRVGGREIGQHIDRALAELPERQREAIVLSHYQALDNPAVAQVLNLSVPAVESLLARARRTLRRQLQPVADEVLRRTS
ncbi:MAG: RNA polymerase sigma factor [Rhodospirillaceae bacterium]|nr:RNA polymerase sigma factor [Rhodospirillaceae bacterium]